MIEYTTTEVANGFIVRFMSPNNYDPVQCAFVKATQDTYVFEELEDMMKRLPDVIGARLANQRINQ